MDLSENVYTFAEHLFSHASDAELSIPHGCGDAPQADLDLWNVTALEWTLARAAALEARRCGKTPGFLLEKTARFLAGRVNNQTGEKVFELEATMPCRPR